MQPQAQATRLWTQAFIALTFCSLLLFLNLQMMLSSFPAYVKNEFHAGDLSVALSPVCLRLPRLVPVF